MANMTLKIGGEVYEFKAGHAFLRDISKRRIVKDKDITRELGLETTVAEMIDGDVETLETVLLTMNKGFEPRLTAKELESYIEDECEDISGLFDQVLDFLLKANCTSLKIRKAIQNAVASGNIQKEVLPEALQKIL